MALKQIKPTTSSSRGKVVLDKKSLWKGDPFKSLCYGFKRTDGRNHSGRITVWGKGGGNKRKYRFVDFVPFSLDNPAKIERIEYDPNRSAFIALLKYECGTMRYELAAHGVKPGDSVLHSSKSGRITGGSSMLIRYAPTGASIYNIEIKKGKGGQLARSAGCYGTLLGKEGDYGIIRLKSGEIRKVNLDCRVYIGVVSNQDHQNIRLGKAGLSRILGMRPTVRGVAMNPVDHPHGGGEGKTSGGRNPVTPWGKLTKGKKTRKKEESSMIVLSRKRSRK